jgi:hypothetical protein
MTFPSSRHASDGWGRFARAGFGAAVACLWAGCPSPPPVRPRLAPPPEMLGPPPAPEFPPAPAPVAPAAAEPVYRNPKIAMVTLRAYQDAAGRLFGPQVMYQVTDPGAWNVEAVEQGKSYIAAANLEVPPEVGSPYVVPAREVSPAPPDSPLLDLGVATKTVITGLGRPEDKPRADQLARQAGGEARAVYDDQLGWLLVPRK